MGVCGGESIDAGETAWPSGSRTSGRTPVSADPAVLLCGPCVVESAGVSKHPINHESVAAGNKPVRLTRPVYQHIQTTSSSDSERPLDVGEDGDSPSLHENQLRRIKENVIAKLKELCPLESQDPVWLETIAGEQMQMFLSMQRADAGNEPAGVECGKEKAVRQHEVPVEDNALASYRQSPRQHPAEGLARGRAGRYGETSVRRRAGNSRQAVPVTSPPIHPASPERGSVCPVSSRHASPPLSTTDGGLLTASREGVSGFHPVSSSRTSDGDPVLVEPSSRTNLDVIMPSRPISTSANRFAALDDSSLTPPLSLSPSGHGRSHFGGQQTATASRAQSVADGVSVEGRVMADVGRKKTVDELLCGDESKWTDSVYKKRQRIPRTYPHPGDGQIVGHVQGVRSRVVSGRPRHSLAGTGFCAVPMARMPPRPDVHNWSTVNKGMRETPRLDGGSTYISHSASHQKLFSVMAKMYPHLTRSECEAAVMGAKMQLGGSLYGRMWNEILHTVDSVVRRNQSTSLLDDIDVG